MDAWGEAVPGGQLNMSLRIPVIPDEGHLQGTTFPIHPARDRQDCASHMVCRGWATPAGVALPILIPSLSLFLSQA